MMNKPRPKTELVVRDVVSFNDLKAIYLTYSSADAERWILQEAPQFGDLLPHKAQSYRLMIDVLMWDTREVAEYLRSYVIDSTQNVVNLLGGFDAS